MGAMFCGIVVAGCAVADGTPSRHLSPSVLNGDPARYNGQTVVVHGFIELAPEGHVLYESQALSAELASKIDAGGRVDLKVYRKYCLTIANPELFYENQTVLNHRTLDVQGKFIDDYLDGHSIDFGACPLPTAIVVDEEDFKGRYKALLTKH
jgi:hypothetical protein